MTGYVRVVLHDLGIGIARGDVVIQLPAAAGNPAGHAIAKFDPAKRRIVPKESVSFAGDYEGDNMFDMSLIEVNHAAFQIECARCVQPHTVEAFSVAWREMHFGVGEAVANRSEDTGPGVVGIDDIVLFAQDTGRRVAGMLEELQVTSLGKDVLNPGGNLPVSDGCPRIGDLDCGLRVNRLRQRPRLVDDLRKRGHTDA